MLVFNRRFKQVKKVAKFTCKFAKRNYAIKF